MPAMTVCPCSDFNPRPPRGGRRQRAGNRHGGTFYFNPRPPRGGRLLQKIAGIPSDRISIHALREEGDDRRIKNELSRKIFQSTPSARRATAEAESAASAVNISIHALREEGDIPKFNKKL